MALYILSYSQDILSVNALMTNRATVIFNENKNKVIHRTDTKFKIHVHNNRLYYLMTAENNKKNSCQRCYPYMTQNTWSLPGLVRATSETPNRRGTSLIVGPKQFFVALAILSKFAFFIPTFIYITN